MDLLAKLLNLKTAYEKLFFKNEFAVFAGKNNSRLLRLISILLITFLALSFARGSYNYLYNKMNNPFTNWVNLPVETDRNRSQKANIKSHFENADELEKYHLKTLKGYKIDNPKWYNQNDERIYSQGRSVDVDDDILKAILNEDNLQWKKNDFVLKGEVEKKFYYDVIVSLDFIKELGYNIEDSLHKIKYDNFDSNKNDLSFWVDILAIVDDLPNQCDFIFFPNLHNSIYNENENPIIPQGERADFQILTKNKDKRAVLDIVIEALGRKGNDVSTLEQDIEVKPFTVAQTDQRNVYKFFFDDGEYEHRKLTSYFSKEKEQNADLEYFIDVQRQKSTKLESIINPYEFAFNFKNLNKVRDFYEFIKNRFGVSIEMSQIEAKENFAFVSALTLITSFVIFALSLTTIIIYLINLLSTHLTSIKKNLGTYKAFGLSDNKLNSIYLKIVFSILCIGTLISFVIIFLIAKLRLVDWLLSIFTNLDASVKSISVFNSWNLISVLILLGLSVFLTQRTIKKILNKSPGDLIYNRA